MTRSAPPPLPEAASRAASTCGGDRRVASRRARVGAAAPPRGPATSKAPRRSAPRARHERGHGEGQPVLAEVDVEEPLPPVVARAVREGAEPRDVREAARRAEREGPRVVEVARRGRHRDQAGRRRQGGVRQQLPLQGGVLLPRPLLGGVVDPRAAALGLEVRGERPVRGRARQQARRAAAEGLDRRGRLRGREHERVVLGRGGRLQRHELRHVDGRPPLPRQRRRRQPPHVARLVLQRHDVREPPVAARLQRADLPHARLAGPVAGEGHDVAHARLGEDLLRRGRARRCRARWARRYKRGTGAHLGEE